MNKSQLENLKSFYDNKVILVTGGTGSIGKEIVKTLLNFNPKAIRVLDINETALFDLEQELNTPKIRAFLGDIRDKDRLKRAVEGVDIIFHAAALKHVPLCEYNPFEAVKTNVIGTQNLIDVAMDEEVEKFITVSTDKAVNPVNVMGATKLLAERLTTSANLYKGHRKTAFSVVRFGNVLNSRGSILPLLKEQLKNGKDITLTHPEMTRFIMSINDAVKLVLKSCTLAKGGEIFILKMPSVKIKDLIEVVVEELAPKYGYDPEEINIKIIGKRPGEKLYEELIVEEEIYKLEELEDMFVVYPYKSNTDNKDKKIIYDSKNTKFLSKGEIKRVLFDIRYLGDNYE
ncbi:polysaccharide biosynthesis protein CapD [Methanococcus aeolicus Nankai-3]|uniref:Polysaccharide biosynthesis protein CapD n=1 Tax=Methanococcus aeolicus (strain ATCC BAA-1280 / DSM 17508 / OCM 812 / Nankai-3) TaxID=419665 RepID=A6UU42_META3|nr:UDP-N-acetylglucosamine 4,6-dehydratase family protein [Methanococcus aeolicus]ABR56014.1 polysaccharide biosynthesis protein CapD [Methanococcus aeolicus Nankai-3]